ncbi:homeotic protein female sterile [Trichonephila clavipes]|nr:homeotic protein female sterile [Trichonephila clavipes]
MSRLYRMSAPSTAPPVLTSKNEKGLFPRLLKRLNIDQENWVSHLLGLLPTEVSHIIAREPDDKANSYEHVKDLLLKRFKLTPEKFRQLFVTHQKAPERTWIDF